MEKYVVMDLEMCRVPRENRKEKYHYHMELIQIAAVELDEKLNITGSFNTFVKPEFGSVDNAIQRLTGITRQDTKSAPYVKEALQAFIDWLPENAILVTWSQNDVEQITNELTYKNIVLPELSYYLNYYEDCQILFGQKMNRNKRYNLKEALSIANIDYDENIHNALVDSANTALLFSKIKQEPQFEVNQYYKTEDNADSCMIQFPFSGLQQLLLQI